MTKTLAITRHPGAKEWLEKHGYKDAEVATSFNIDHVSSGMDVIGSMPVKDIAEICSLGARYHHLSFDEAAMGLSLSAREMESCGAYLTNYLVVETEKQPDTVEFDDYALSRQRIPIGVFVTEDGILKFHGKSIPGIVSASVKDKNEDAMTDAYKYDLRLAEGVTFVRLVPSFKTSKLLEGTTWGEAYDYFCCTSGVVVDRAAFENGWRIVDPPSASEYDRVDDELENLSNGRRAMKELFARALAGETIGVK